MDERKVTNPFTGGGSKPATVPLGSPIGSPLSGVPMVDPETVGAKKDQLPNTVPQQVKRPKRLPGLKDKK